MQLLRGFLELQQAVKGVLALEQVRRCAWCARSLTLLITKAVLDCSGMQPTVLEPA